MGHYTSKCFETCLIHFLSKLYSQILAKMTTKSGHFMSFFMCFLRFWLFSAIFSDFWAFEPPPRPENLNTPIFTTCFTLDIPSVSILAKKWNLIIPRLAKSGTMQNSKKRPFFVDTRVDIFGPKTSQKINFGKKMPKHDKNNIYVSHTLKN